MMSRSIACSCLTVLALACSVRTLASDSGATQARSIREIVSELRRFDDTSQRDVDVPRPVSQDLTALKHRLRDLIVDVAGARGTIASDPSTLEARVIAHLESEDIPIEDMADGFGVITGIHFHRPSEYPDWLIATTTVSIPYGSDTSLYLFEPQGSSWKHILTLEANGYSDISGAQGGLEYYVPPVSRGKKPYLVTADVTPWNASVWQTLRLRVLRPGSTPNSPLILATRALGYCLDQRYYLSIGEDGFGLIYLGYPVDRQLAGWRGVHYLEYAVQGNTASLVKETAIDPYNVVREWTAQAWSISSRSVESSADGGIRQWHERFRKEEWSCGLGSIQLGHRTEGDRDLLLAASPCSRNGQDETSAYVLLAARRDGFQIASISETQPIPDEGSGYRVYYAGGPGLTDPVPESTIEPKSPPGVRLTSGTPVELELQIIVNEDGNVGSVGVRSWPDDEEGIVVPAIRAVREWKYKPGLIDGHAVRVSMPVIVVFEPAGP